MVRAFINKEIELKKLDVRSKSIETTLPLRLQAYERVTLFLERIAPQNILIRLNNSGFTARDLQRLLLDEIRNEYNHNVSQQIYISEEGWNLVRNAKEDLILMINDAITNMNAESTGMDLAKKIFELSMEKKVDVNEHAIREIKKEIQQTF